MTMSDRLCTTNMKKGQHKLPKLKRIEQKEYKKIEQDFLNMWKIFKGFINNIPVIGVPT